MKLRKVSDAARPLVFASSIFLSVGMGTFLSAVISGRRASVEPGIHMHRLWLWIPRLRLAAHAGMTAERVWLKTRENKALISL